MGRKLMRVALDFIWPMDVPWKGFMNPYRPTECKPCSGSGLNPATKKLSDDWYTHSRTDGLQGWGHDLEQAEVDALVEAGRLMDFTHTFTPGKGWAEREDKYRPTAEEVNKWSHRFMGHDAINQWICVEARAKRLGIYGKCELCKGAGHYWCEEKYEELWNDWESTPPPSGDGWQVWETVSEGSPVTPVFATAEELIAHLATHGDAWDQHRNSGGWGVEQARAFVKAEWVPSLITTPSGVFESRDIALQMAQDQPKAQ